MADTVINTLYPPIIETFQPAFLYNSNVPITFSLSPFNSVTDIQAIHISVVDQRNNSNVLKTNLDPDNPSKWIQSQKDIQNDEETDYSYAIINGILIFEFPAFDLEDNNTQTQGFFQYDPINNLYAINLFPEWLKKTDVCWNNNQYYQVQIRLDICDTIQWKNASIENFANYMLDKREYFSEWSSVTLIKPILEPVLSITQLDASNINYTYAGNFHINGYVIFKQDKTNNGVTWPETERLQAYRIITQKEETNNLVTIDDSDWIYARQNLLKEENATIDYLLDLMAVNEGDNLVITIYCRTNNGYVFNQSYDVTISTYSKTLDNVRWNNFTPIENNANIININQEDGAVEINFSADCSETAIIYFRRACSKDDFKTWELIYRYDFTITGNNTTCVVPSFYDFTVCSLYQYKYSAQACVIATDNKETWSKIYISDPVYPKFYDMLLMRQNQQIAIRYNGQVSSWKPTVNRQKIDTLGGRYPKFVENAIMNYKTYSISGLITAEEDFNRTFLSELNDANVGYYDNEFNTQYIIRNDSAVDGENEYPEIDHQHDSYPQDHWYWEREFREQLVAWLNDGEPKLYRSMPEGNLSVMLTDINLTPNAQLGRRLYNFSATMYEIGDGYSLEELNKLNIINIPNTDTVFLTEFNFNIDNNEENEASFTDLQIGQTTISSLNSTSNWVNGTSAILNTNALWETMSLKEKLDAYHMGSGGELDVIQNSIRLTNVSIQFNTSPHYYEHTDDGFILSWDDKIGEIETEWLGYVINIDTKQENKTTTQQIFINQKGYYHIPNSIIVDNIRILSNVDTPQEALVSYQYQYRTKTSSKVKTHGYTPLGKILGQYTGDILPLDTNIISLIYENHKKPEYRNGQLYGEIHLKECKGLMLDVTPYTYIEYKHQEKLSDNNNYKLVIGQTGVFNAFEDWPLSSLKILGRRMIKVNTYPYHIEEWEYFVNNQSYTSINDINSPKFNTVYNINGIYKIYYIDGCWYSLADDFNIANDTTIAKVPIYGMINYHGELEKEIF